jgi:hypothetical protein
VTQRQRSYDQADSGAGDHEAIAWVSSDRNEDAEEPRSEALPYPGHEAVPSTAEARLRALSADGQLFTSGLSVKEFALLD